MKKYYDISGVLLSPYQPDICRGNGRHKNIECCCDNCAFQIGCLLLDSETSAETIQELNALGYTKEQNKIDDWQGNKKPKKYNLEKLVKRTRREWKKSNF